MMVEPMIQFLIIGDIYIYNARSDWLILEHYSTVPIRDTHDYGPAKNKQKDVYNNKQSINLARSVLTGKSQTTALPH